MTVTDTKCAGGTIIRGRQNVKKLPTPPYATPRSPGYGGLFLFDPVVALVNQTRCNYSCLTIMAHTLTAALPFGLPLDIVKNVILPFLSKPSQLFLSMTCSSLRTVFDKPEKSQDMLKVLLKPKRTVKEITFSETARDCSINILVYDTIFFWHITEPI